MLGRPRFKHELICVGKFRKVLFPRWIGQLDIYTYVYEITELLSVL
jgi:hypothetical protein